MKKATESKNSMTRMALKALREAVAEVVEEHRREGRPLAVWRNGKAVLVSLKEKVVLHESTAKYRTRTRPKKS